MSKSSMLLKIESRTKSIWDELNATHPAILNDLLMSPAEVKEELNKIEIQPIIDHFTKELQQAIETANNDALTYEAICYEWYHDRFDLRNPAIGKAYEKCAHTLLSNINTGLDNNWTVTNDTKPTLSGNVLDINRLSVSLITHLWYDLIGRSEEKQEVLYSDFYDNTPMTLFDELFKLKLFTLLDAAYTNVTVKKPSYFSVSIYGYWHSIVTEYRIEAQPKLTN